MRVKTDVTQTSSGGIACPDLVQAYVLRARRERAEFIAMSWRALSARLRAWLTGDEAETRHQAPRIVAHSKPRSSTPTGRETRRAA